MWPDPMPHQHAVSRLVDGQGFYGYSRVHIDYSSREIIVYPKLVSRHTNSFHPVKLFNCSTTRTSPCLFHQVSLILLRTCASAVDPEGVAGQSREFGGRTDSVDCACTGQLGSQPRQVRSGISAFGRRDSFRLGLQVLVWFLHTPLSCPLGVCSRWPTYPRYPGRNWIENICLDVVLSSAV